MRDRVVIVTFLERYAMGHGRYEGEKPFVRLLSSDEATGYVDVAVALPCSGERRRDQALAQPCADGLGTGTSIGNAEK